MRKSSTNRFAFPVVSFVLLILNAIIFNISDAATIKATYEKNAVAPGSNISVAIQIDPDGLSPNAFEGSVSIADNAKLISIDDADSIVTLWVEYPRLVEDRVVFSGILPGGFSGILSADSDTLLPGTLFSLILSVPNDGDVLIAPTLKVVYEKDGLSISDKFYSEPINIPVKSGATLVDQSLVTNVDKYPPEPFEVHIAKDQDVFGGKYFIVFNTYDRGSGISFYSVEEGDTKPVTTASPYVLTDQSLGSHVVVRAYDKAGNFREELLDLSRYSHRSFKSVFLWGIMTLLILVVLVVGRKYLKK